VTDDMQGATVLLLGTIASALSTVSLMPQVIRTWRTRSARDISSAWLIVALVSMGLWIAYGVTIGAQAIVWANALTALQAIAILAVKVTEPALPPTGQGLEPTLYQAPGIASSTAESTGEPI
jgi:MtN3 and saliva related transmembrane protein